MMNKKPAGVAIMLALKKKGDDEMGQMKEHLAGGSAMSLVEKIHSMEPGEERDAMISKAISALEAMKGGEDDED